MYIGSRPHQEVITISTRIGSKEYFLIKTTGYKEIEIWRFREEYPDYDYELDPETSSYSLKIYRRVSKDSIGYEEKIQYTDHRKKSPLKKLFEYLGKRAKQKTKPPYPFLNLPTLTSK